MSVGVHAVALRSAAIVLLVLLCLLHGCAGVPTSLNSVATSFEASCERLPCGKPSAECFEWSLHSLPPPPFSLFLLSLSLLLHSLSLSLSSQARLSSARDLQHWTWRLHCCFAGTKHQHVLDLTVDLTWHLLDHLHRSLCLCILHDVLITRSGTGTCCASSVLCNVCVWRYSGIASLLTRQRSYTAAVKLQCSAALSGCTALVATSTVFATCGRSCRYTAPGESRFSAHGYLGSLDLLGHLIHSSG